jgi:hypothetical protein
VDNATFDLTPTFTSTSPPTVTSASSSSSYNSTDMGMDPKPAEPKQNNTQPAVDRNKFCSDQVELCFKV